MVGRLRAPAALEFVGQIRCLICPFGVVKTVGLAIIQSYLPYREPKVM